MTLMDQRRPSSLHLGGVVATQTDKQTAPGRYGPGQFTRIRRAELASDGGDSAGRAVVVPAVGPTSVCGDQAVARRAHRSDADGVALAEPDLGAVTDDLVAAGDQRGRRR